MSTTVIPTRALRPLRFWESTNGQKAIMAVTGLVLFLFVIFHMIGNLQVFEGSEQLNFYGFALRRFPEALWERAAFAAGGRAAHLVVSQASGAEEQRPPTGYATRKNTVSTYASRTMYWSGPILLAFVIYHILHLTAGYFRPAGFFREGDVYRNLVAGFQVWYVSAWYIFSMVLLGLHIRHGAWSMFQSLGLNHPRHTPILKKFAAALAIVIVAGYISIPLSVMLGLVR